MVDITRLIPYARNSRTHSDEQVSQIMASIKEWGFTVPVLIDAEGVLIAGHGRLLAAQRLDMPQVPSILCAGWTDAQKRAYIIADNKLALNAGWDDEMLRVELSVLGAEGYDLDLTGFDVDEIAALQPDICEPGLTDDDAAPPLPENPVTVLGDMWALGDHVVLCGDSTSVDNVDKLLGPHQADLIFTDPPYGMSYGGGRAAGSTDKGALVKAHGEILGDSLQGDELLQMVSDSVGNAVVSAKAGAAAYVCLTWRTFAEFTGALHQIGLETKACIVWDKKSIGLGRSNYRPQHEFIFYSGGPWYGDKAQSDVWYMTRGSTVEYVHPTQKPVELIERAIYHSSKAGDVVHDCFGGSGSTLIACEKTGRVARLMELDPKYCDAIIERWQSYTGKNAILSTGETFMEVKNARTQAETNAA